ncbi:MAG: diphthine--ammonia ligase [Ignavibacteriae bacterium]|nr:MAG: diphthine--ammonia ligase [Ignavibacteriota bacterium]
MKYKAVLNWSGGKDSSLSLYKVLKDKRYDVCSLLTTINDEFNRVSMHGVRTELLEAQAKAIGIPLTKIMLPEVSDIETYNNVMFKTMDNFRKQFIYTSIFGDIFLEDLRKYREEQLAKLKISAYFPLWKKSTKSLVKEFIDLGFKAVVVCVNEKYLDKSFAGRIIDESFLNDLPANVDPCGENGEYHSFVFAGPIFQKPVNYKLGEITYRHYTDPTNGQSSLSFDTGFWYCDLMLN